MTQVDNAPNAGREFLLDSFLEAGESRRETAVVLEDGDGFKTSIARSPQDRIVAEETSSGATIWPACQRRGPDPVEEFDSLVSRQTGFLKLALHIAAPVASLRQVYDKRAFEIVKQAHASVNPVPSF
jgi:hypothetical protein